MNDERREIAKRVMKAMRFTSTRQPLASKHLIICLRSDTVEYALGRVREAGGEATVVVPQDDGLVPLTWLIRPPGDTLQLDGVEQLVQPHSELGMVVDLLASSGHPSMSFRMAVADVAVTEGEILTVPA